MKELTTQENSFIAHITNELRVGNLNPAEVTIMANIFFKQIKELQDEAKDLLLEQMEKDGNAPIKLNGYEITRVNGRKTYKFDHIQDYKEAKKGLKEMEEKYKQAADMTTKGLMAVAEGGEIVEAAKIEFAKDTVRITKSKK